MTSLCPDCGVELQRGARRDPAPEPLQQTTPLSRLSALADEMGVDVFTVSTQDTDGLAAAVAVALDDTDQLRATIGLAEDLDDDLRTDVFAFAMALFVGTPERLVRRKNRCLGIGRNRRRPAKKGPGHLAWHMLYSCGRDTLSATFDLVAI